MPKSEKTLRKELQERPEVFARETDALYSVLLMLSAEITKRYRDRDRDQQQTRH